MRYELEHKFACETKLQYKYMQHKYTSNECPLQFSDMVYFSNINGLFQKLMASP